jgi:MerR family transcriptional regulator, copper efflux regulator
MDTMTIGKVARASGTGVETIRYYEREGLVETPARTVSGYRHYRPEVIARLRFIRHAKELGFSLNEIRELLSLRVTAGTTCREVKSRAEQKSAIIDQRIAALRRMKRALEKLAATCSGRGPVSECPILEALETRGPEA